MTIAAGSDGRHARGPQRSTRRAGARSRVVARAVAAAWFSIAALGVPRGLQAQDESSDETRPSAPAAREFRLPDHGLWLRADIDRLLDTDFVDPWTRTFERAWQYKGYGFRVRDVRTLETTGRWRPGTRGGHRSVECDVVQIFDGDEDYVGLRALSVVHDRWFWSDVVEDLPGVERAFAGEDGESLCVEVRKGLLVVGSEAPIRKVYATAPEDRPVGTTRLDALSLVAGHARAPLQFAASPPPELRKTAPVWPWIVRELLREDAARLRGVGGWIEIEDEEHLRVEVLLRFEEDSADPAVRSAPEILADARKRSLAFLAEHELRGTAAWIEKAKIENDGDGDVRIRWDLDGAREVLAFSAVCCGFVVHADQNAWRTVFRR